MHVKWHEYVEQTGTIKEFMNANIQPKLNRRFRGFWPVNTPEIFAIKPPIRLILVQVDSYGPPLSSDTKKTNKQTNKQTNQNKTKQNKKKTTYR